MHRFASNLARSNTVHRIRYALLKKLRYWTSQGTVESPTSVVLKPISSRGHTILFTPFAHSAMGLTRNISLLTRNAFHGMSKSHLWHNTQNRFYCTPSSRVEFNSMKEIGVAEESRLTIASWLILSAGFVFGIVSVGGLTRLMDAGLSITDWKPITGIIPPLTEEDWEHEFNKYKQFPEFKVLFSDMKMEEFKRIFFMEWLHRVLGRGIGVLFGVPFLYFTLRGKLSKRVAGKLLGIFAMGGAQGALGWYMVKSGLETKDDEIPRVSPYRLCAHLGSAFVIYLGIIWVVMNIMRPTIVMKRAIPNWFKYSVGGIFGLTFSTAMSGAFVAGLDAGLVHNEFPKMGEGYVPETYWDLQPSWKNFFENDAAVQFNHRVLGISTLTAITTLWMLAPKSTLPKPTRYALHAMLGMSWTQAGLGLFTLLYFVPIPLAAAHQAGSLTLLTFATWALHTLKRKPLPVKIRAIPK